MQGEAFDATRSHWVDHLNTEVVRMGGQFIDMEGHQNAEKAHIARMSASQQATRDKLALVGGWESLRGKSSLYWQAQHILL